MRSFFTASVHVLLLRHIKNSIKAHKFYFKTTFHLFFATPKERVTDHLLLLHCLIIFRQTANETGIKYTNKFRWYLAILQCKLRCHSLDYSSDFIAKVAAESFTTIHAVNLYSKRERLRHCGYTYIHVCTYKAGIDDIILYIRVYVYVYIEYGLLLGVFFTFFTLSLWPNNCCWLVLSSAAAATHILFSL